MPQHNPEFNTFEAAYRIPAPPEPVSVYTDPLPQVVARVEQLHDRDTLAGLTTGRERLVNLKGTDVTAMHHINSLFLHADITGVD
jgi:hypothetical protein